MANEILEPCTEECEWQYYHGDSSVGEGSYWECITCGKVDVDREPPSEEDFEEYLYDS